MTRIGPSDQLMLLLQERLKTFGKERAVKTAAPTRARPDLLSDARTFDALDPDERRRVVIRSILIQQLGETVANDPAFAMIAADVARIIAEDEEGGELLGRVIEQASQIGLK